jgi:hypothetical protein
LLQNRLLKRVFGLKKDEVTEEWGRLHNEELYALYSIIILRWTGHVALMYGRRGV